MAKRKRRQTKKKTNHKLVTTKPLFDHALLPGIISSVLGIARRCQMHWDEQAKNLVEQSLGERERASQASYGEKFLVRLARVLLAYSDDEKDAERRVIVGLRKPFVEWLQELWDKHEMRWRKLSITTDKDVWRKDAGVIELAKRSTAAYQEELVVGEHLHHDLILERLAMRMARAVSRFMPENNWAGAAELLLGAIEGVSETTAYRWREEGSPVITKSEIADDTQQTSHVDLDLHRNSRAKLAQYVLTVLGYDDLQTVQEELKALEDKDDEMMDLENE